MMLDGVLRSLLEGGNKQKETQVCHEKFKKAKRFKGSRELKGEGGVTRRSSPLLLGVIILVSR